MDPSPIEFVARTQFVLRVWLLLEEKKTEQE